MSAAASMEGAVRHGSLVTPQLIRGLLSRFTNTSTFFASPQQQMLSQAEPKAFSRMGKSNTFRPMQYFPNLPLIVRHKSEKATKTPGGSRKVTFQTTPNITKIEIKNFLSEVYGFNVQKVNTLNVEHRRQIRRTRDANLSRPWTSIHTYKKAIVTMFPSAPAPLEARALPYLRHLISSVEKPDLSSSPTSSASLSSSSSTEGRVEVLPSYEGTTRKTRREVVVEFKKELRVARQLQKRGLLQKFVDAAEQQNDARCKKLFDRVLATSKSLLRLPSKKSGHKWWTIRRR